MKNLILLLIVTLSLSVFASNSINKKDDSVLLKKKVSIGCSIQDAEIFVNGKLMGKGNLDITVASKSCVTVIVKATGYFTKKNEFCNKKGWTKPPKTYYFEMITDDSFEAIFKYSNCLSAIFFNWLDFM